MSTTSPPTSLPQALGLLERAIGYTRASLMLLVDCDSTDRPTPCTRWNLDGLLRHMNDSLTTLQEGADLGYVGLDPTLTNARSNELVASIRTRACAVLGAWSNKQGADLVSVAGSPMAATLMVSTGALEITVHGWDVATACGQYRPIPASLATALLDVAPLLVSDADRPWRFAAQVEVPPGASPSRHLLGYLGRRAPQSDVESQGA